MKEALLALNKNKDSPGVLSKNIDKDIIVIRSLANLNDAPAWMNKSSPGVLSKNTVSQRC